MIFDVNTVTDRQLDTGRTERDKVIIEPEDIKITIFKSMQEQNSDFISTRIEENIIQSSKLDNRCVQVEFLRIQIILNKT